MKKISKLASKTEVTRVDVKFLAWCGCQATEAALAKDRLRSLNIICKSRLPVKCDSNQWSDQIFNKTDEYNTRQMAISIH